MIPLTPNNQTRNPESFLSGYRLQAKRFGKV